MLWENIKKANFVFIKYVPAQASYSKLIKLLLPQVIVD
jgi:hypothetical protein